MKAAAAAIESFDFDIKGNISRISELLLKARKKGAAYLFLGESVLNGFDGLSWDYDRDYLENAVSADDEHILSLRSLCRKNCTGLGFGCYEKHALGISSSYFIIDPNGVINACYRRISPGWKPRNEIDRRYKDGDDTCVLSFEGNEWLVSICGDLWTEEYIEAISALEFDNIIWPLYIDYTWDEWERSAQREYCEQISTIGKRTILINSIGPRTDSAKGGVMEISAQGQIIQQIEMGSSEIMIFDLK